MEASSDSSERATKQKRKQEEDKVSSSTAEKKRKLSKSEDAKEGVKGDSGVEKKKSKLNDKGNSNDQDDKDSKKKKVDDETLLKRKEELKKKQEAKAEYLNHLKTVANELSTPLEELIKGSDKEATVSAIYTEKIDEKIPLRNMTGFMFYDESKSLQPLEELSNEELYCVGIIYPPANYTNYKAEAKHIQFKITEWSIEWTRGKQGIWIKSRSSWYRLHHPHPKYLETYSSVYKKFRMSVAVLSLLEKNDNLSVEDGLKKIVKNVKKSDKTLIKSIDQNDVIREAQFIYSQIRAVNDSKAKSKFMRELKKKQQELGSENSSSSSTTQPSKKRKSTDNQSTTSSKDEVQRKEKIKYPIEDLKLDNVKPERRDLLVHLETKEVKGNSVAELFMCWQFLHTYKRLFKGNAMSLIELECYLYSQQYRAPLASLHIQLLRYLLQYLHHHHHHSTHSNNNEEEEEKSEEEDKAAAKRVLVFDALKKVPLDNFTWPEVLRQYLVLRMKDNDMNVNNVEDLSPLIDALNTTEYPQLPVRQKIALLAFLFNDLIDTQFFWEKIQEGIEAVEEIKREKHEEDLKLKENKKKRKEELATLATLVKEQEQGTNGNHGNDAPSKKKSGSLSRKDSDVIASQRKLQKLKQQEQLKMQNEKELSRVEELQKQKREEAFERALSNARNSFRPKLLGSDRFHNRYWLFNGTMSYEFGPLVAMETMNGCDWYVFDKQENFDEFVKTLNQKGVREKALLKAFEEHAATIQKGFARKKSKYQRLERNSRLFSFMFGDDAQHSAVESGLERDISMTAAAEERAVPLLRRKSSRLLHSSSEGTANTSNDAEKEVTDDDSLPPFQQLLNKLIELEDEVLWDVVIDQKAYKKNQPTWIQRTKNATSASDLAKQLLAFGSSLDLQNHSKWNEKTINNWKAACAECSTLHLFAVLFYSLRDAIHQGVAIDSKLCKVCKLGDKAAFMLLCDSCNEGYHTFCLVPRLKAIPKSSWYCPKCS